MKMPGNTVCTSAPVELENDPGSPNTEDELDTSAEGKSHRPRKKHIYDQLLKQLEFYLGDANLSKDRFLSQKIQQNPQLPVELFLSFNKIRNHTCDVKDLVIALKKSNLLELTEDETKVFRKTEVKKRENQDECTIYVENLPSDAHHDWLTRIFISYGNVLYVSIPKFKNSRQNKGFAFIEFDSPDCVAKVLEAFGAAGCRLSADMPSEQLLSIQTFEDDQGKSLYHNSDTSTPQVLKITAKVEADEPSNTEDRQESLGKRKRGSAGQEQSSDDTSKKSKLSENVLTDGDGVTLDTPAITENVITPEKVVTGDTSVPAREEGVVEEANAEQDSLDMDQDSSDGDMTADDKKRKARNRKNHKKGKKKQHLEVASLGLRVLSKREWKRLRNKYLNMQREKMASLKQQVFEARLLAAQEQQRQHEQLQQNHLNGKEPPTYAFTAAVILKVEPHEYIEDIRQFKMDAREVKGVNYVDIVPERKHVYIRCESAEAATALLTANTWPNMSLLQGEEEKGYWQKIGDDRDAKLQKKRGKERGRGKLLQRAHKLNVRHMHFPEEEGEQEAVQEESAAAATTVSGGPSGQRQHIRFPDEDEEKAPDPTTPGSPKLPTVLDIPTVPDATAVTTSSAEPSTAPQP